MVPDRGTPGQEAGESPNGHREHPARQVWPTRQQPAAWPRNGDHPLTKTHFGQHPVHPMSGQACHAAASTRRAEATAAA